MAEEKEIKVQNDGPLFIAVGNGRKELSWKNREWSWGQFLNKIKTTQRTAETMAEFRKISKTRQDEIKDVGGFVGGYVNGGRRNKGSVAERTMATLDIDFAIGDVWEDFCLMFGCAAAVYSTHKHTPDAPRLRLVTPFSRPVGPDEYQAVCRYIAGTIGIDMFDDTTYEPERLMYWPSTSKDGQYIFQYQDGTWLDVDAILATYKNWKDASEWPVSSRVDVSVRREIKKQGDPLEKPGIVGAFCRTYDIHQAIENFLPDDYVPCGVDNRYTYIHGSTGAGLVVYEDKFAYSHHGTDPSSGKLCNAFDLVRLHLFGDKDEDIDTNTNRNITKYPSYLAMGEFASKDKAVMTTIAREKLTEAGEDFANILDEEESSDWLAEMDVDRKGNYLATPKNVDLILKNDPNLKKCFAYDVFNDRKALLRLPPWRIKGDAEMFIRDDDEANLRLYLSKEPWGLEGKQKIADALDVVCRENAFHPVREYFNTLTWDGVRRLDTLFIDYLGAEDTELNRLITRIAFTAAVYRTYEPGTKYDQIVVLVGTQGCGKSTIIEKMAINQKWFSNSMPSPDKPEDAARHLRGKFIIEVGELVGFKKAEVEAIKNFLSKTADDFHAHYGKNDVHRPRQCIFFASTNEEQFLRDSSGERRYWPIKNCVIQPKYNVWENLTPDIVGQIWAEAIQRYRERIPLLLPVELSNALHAVQEEYKKVDEWQGIIEEFLNTRLPSDWTKRNNQQKRDYFFQQDVLSADGVILRDKVCIAEILNECSSLGIKGTPGQIEKNRISAIMKEVKGWNKSKNKINAGSYGRQYGWVKVEKNLFEDAEGIFDKVK